MQDMKTMQLEIGKPAPNFTLPSSIGRDVSLEEFSGKNVVLYFYPKDNTKGCTQQACDFRDSMEEYESADTVVIGVSKDTIKSHNNFIEKYSLPFVLLSDVETIVHQMYDAWKLKKMYGREYMGTERSTFIIDKNGILVKEYRGVKVKNHIREVLDFISENLK